MAMDAPLLTPGGGASLSPSDGSIPAIAVVIIDAYTAAIKPAMNGVLIATAFTGAMFPLLVALFLFSNGSLRRKPIFIACVIDVLFNMVGGSLAAALQALAILRPFETSDILFPAAVFITTSCIVSGSILMLRLVAVYPPAMLSWPARLVVYGPPIAFKVARITNNAIFLHLFEVRVDQSGLTAAQSAWRLSGTRIELALQMVDNSYMSLMFLYKLWRITRSATTTRITTSYIKRIRTLIWIASSNFIMPCFLSLAQIIFVRVDSSFYTGSTVISLFLVNTFVETTGALLATIWAASNHWQAEHAPRSSTNTTATYSLPTIRDLKASSAIMESRSDIQDGRAKPIVGEGASSVVTLPEKVVVISGGEHKLDLDPSRPIV